MQFTTILASAFAAVASAQYVATTYSGISSPLYASTPVYAGNYGGYGRPQPVSYRPQPFGGRPSLGRSQEYSFTGARCARVNGQCYENNCNGSPDSPYCKTGEWAGCPCGFECAPTNGLCRDNGCAGVPSGRFFGDGVCTQQYVGCSCNLY